MLLETHDIRLIPANATHRESFLELLNIPEINHRVNKPFPYLPHHFDDLLLRLEKNGLHVWMIEKSDNIAGVINTGALRHPRVFQGGYWIHPQYWGQKIMSSALPLVRDYLFAHQHAERVQAVVEPDNTASIRVLEKSGYVREGLLRKFYPTATRDLIDVYMYGYVRN